MSLTNKTYLPYFYTEFNAKLSEKKPLSDKILVKYEGVKKNFNIYYNDCVDNVMEDDTKILQYRTLIPYSEHCVFITHLVENKQTGELFYPMYKNKFLDMWVEYIIKGDMTKKIKDPFDISTNNNIEFTRTVYLEEQPEHLGVRCWAPNMHIEQAYNTKISAPKCNCCNGTRKKEEDITPDTMVISTCTSITIKHDEFVIKFSKDNINIAYTPYIYDKPNLMYNISTKDYDIKRWNSESINTFSYDAKTDNITVNNKGGWIFCDGWEFSKTITINKGKFFMEEIEKEKNKKESYYEKEKIILKYPKFLADDTLWSSSNLGSISYLENWNKSKDIQTNIINKHYINDVKVYNDNAKVKKIINGLKALYKQIKSLIKLDYEFDEVNMLRFEDLTSLKEIHDDFAEKLFQVTNMFEFKEIIDLLQTINVTDLGYSVNTYPQNIRAMYDLYSKNISDVKHMIIKPKYNEWELLTNIDGYIVCYCMTDKNYLTSLSKKWFPDRELIEFENYDKFKLEKDELYEDMIQTEIIDITNTNVKDLFATI